MRSLLVSALSSASTCVALLNLSACSESAMEPPPPRDTIVDEMLEQPGSMGPVAPPVGTTDGTTETTGTTETPPDSPPLVPGTNVENGEGTQPPLPLASTGVAIGGACRPLCIDGSTDADAMGQVDGWGWENEQSCVVTGSAVAAGGTPCDLAPPAALPPLPPVPDGEVTRPEGVESAGFFVSGGRLYDRRGNDFVMRGVNNPLAWFRDRNTGALAWLDEIASTGANAVRLVWETTATDTQLLRDSVERSLQLRMVPMIELHDVTGGTTAEGLLDMARHYTETDALKQILLDYEDSLLVNIANEWSGSNAIYVQAYTDAINVFRAAGIRHTLVLDSNGYGQNANTVLNQGQALLAADPQHNLLFSVHMYEQYRSAQTIRDTLQRAATAQLPFIVGEFGFQHGSDNQNQGNPYPIPYDVLLEESERYGFGYLAWSWTGNSGGVEYLDLTARSGSASSLSAWGDGVVNGPNGIRATAEPASIFAE
ncbi:MAG TPA: cellulase family glycosylhydrolase [Polyangiaceae bacterium]|nr:cellulase family glycosylhydrolase [Polyangiaceae bacterium]